MTVSHLPHPDGYLDNVVPDDLCEADGRALEDLHHAVASAWSEHTTADPAGWLDRRDAGMIGAPGRAYGQCAASALVIQDRFGGDLLRTLATSTLPDGTLVTDSHYYNRLPGGHIVDVTRTQFPTGTTFTDAETRDRSYVHGGGSTAGRYQRIADHVTDRAVAPAS